MDDRRQRAADAIRRMVDGDGADVWRAWDDYCDETGEDRVLDMCALDEYVDAEDIVSIAAAAYRHEFNPSDPYFWFDAYGAIESAKRLRDTPIDADAMADYAVEHGCDFDIPEVRDILAGSEAA